MGAWIVAGVGLAALLLFGMKLEGATKGAGPNPIPTIEVIPSTPGSKYPYPTEVNSASTRYGVDPNIVAAVVSWEQRSDKTWNPKAVNPSDPSYGLGQVTPYIGVKAGVIPSEKDYTGLFDPQRNLNAVAWFLHYLLWDMKFSLDEAVQIYNLGESRWAQGKRVPDYLAGVMGYLRKFRGW